MVVNDLADLTHRLLEDAVGGRVGDHERGERVRVLLRARLQVLDVDVAGVVALHRDDLHARHHGAGRVRAVRAHGNQAHVALRLVVVAVVGPDHHQAGVLALRTRVRLERYGFEARDLREDALEPVEELAVSLALVLRREGVQLPNSGQVTGTISVEALSFIVQQPSGIIDVTSERSRDCSRCR